MVDKIFAMKLLLNLKRYHSYNPTYYNELFLLNAVVIFMLRAKFFITLII